MDLIIEAAKDVHNTLGYGLSEVVYQKALALKLKQNFDQIELERSVPIKYLNHELTTLRADIVVNNIFILELKATTSKLSDKETNQINRYMKILNIPAGVLINFSQELEIKQIFL